MNGDETTNHEDMIDGLPDETAAQQASVYSLTANEALRQLAAEQSAVVAAATTVQPSAHPAALTVTGAVSTNVPVRQVVTAQQTTVQTAMHPQPPMPTPTGMPQVAPMAVETKLATLLAGLNGGPPPQVSVAPTVRVARWGAKPICLMPQHMHPYVASPLPWVRPVPDPVQTTGPVPQVPGAPPSITYKQMGVEYENFAGFPNPMILGGVSGLMTGLGGLPFFELTLPRWAQDLVKKFNGSASATYEKFRTDKETILATTQENINDAIGAQAKKDAADAGKKLMRDLAKAAKDKIDAAAGEGKKTSDKRISKDLGKNPTEAAKSVAQGTKKNTNTAIDMSAESAKADIDDFLYRNLFAVLEALKGAGGAVTPADVEEELKENAEEGKKKLANEIEKANEAKTAAEEELERAKTEEAVKAAKEKIEKAKQKIDKLKTRDRNWDVTIGAINRLLGNNTKPNWVGESKHLSLIHRFCSDLIAENVDGSIEPPEEDKAKNGYSWMWRMRVQVQGLDAGPPSTPEPLEIPQEIWNPGANGKKELDLKISASMEIPDGRNEGKAGKAYDEGFELDTGGAMIAGGVYNGQGGGASLGGVWEEDDVPGGQMDGPYAGDAQHNTWTWRPKEPKLVLVNPKQCNLIYLKVWANCGVGAGRQKKWYMKRLLHLS